MNCPLVIVRWEDSAQPVARWQHLAEMDMPEVVECATVGWLIRDDDKVKVVAQSMGGINTDDNIQTSGVMAIPARCVISIERLQETTVTSSCSGAVSGPTPLPTSELESTSGC